MAVEVIDRIKPKNGGSFPIVEAVDVEVSDGLRLPEALSQKAEQTDLEELSSALSEKADQSDLDALETKVDAKADSSDLTTAAANLQAQIDNLITPVSQDAEVQNARVGADGTSYQTLKARLDAEQTSLKNDLTDLDVAVFGEYEYPELTEHTNLFIGQTGIVVTYNDASIVTCEINEGETYEITAENNQILRYSASNTYPPTNNQDVSGLMVTSEDPRKAVFVNTAGARYLYVDCKAPNYQNVKIKVKNVDEHTEGIIDNVEKLSVSVESISDEVISIDDNLADLDEVVYGKDEYAELSEHTDLYIGQTGVVVTYNDASIVTCEINEGETYEITAKNNQILRFSASSTYPPTNNQNVSGLMVTSENPERAVFTNTANVRYLYIDCKTPDYPNVEIKVKKLSEHTDGIIDNIEKLSESVQFISDETSKDPKEYTLIDDCKALGKLTKQGMYIVDGRGERVELRGIGLHGILQYPNLHTRDAFLSLKNMGINCIRMSIYLEDFNTAASDGEPLYGWLNHKEDTKREINKIIRNCIDLGLYVIVDWHVMCDNSIVISTPVVTGVDRLWQSEAIEFFEYICGKYGSYPNLIYEIANEPYDVDAEDLADYTSVISATIKEYVEDPIIICGVGKHTAAYISPFTTMKELHDAFVDKNITDVFVSQHAYGYDLSVYLEYAVSYNIPFFITEWGNSTSTGDGAGDDAAAESFMEWMHTNEFGHCVWKFTDQTMTTSALKNQGIINSEKYLSGFDEKDLTHNGNLILGKFKSYITE